MNWALSSLFYTIPRCTVDRLGKYKMMSYVEMCLDGSRALLRSESGDDARPRMWGQGQEDTGLAMRLVR